MKKLTGFYSLILCLLASSISSAGAATTNAITAGQIVPGSITAPDQVNFYSFSAVSNDMLYLTVVLTNGPGVNPYLYLYDPAGELVTEGPANWYLTYVPNLRLTKTGTYTVAVIDDGHDESFDYLITYNLARGGVNQREPGDGPEVITPGQTGYGRISLNDYDTFTFTALSNDVLYLTVIKTNGPGNGPYLYLYDPAGEIVTEGPANWYLTYVSNLRLSKTGTYTVAVIDDGHDESFDYLITYNLARGGVNQREPGDGPEAITPGRNGYGHISPNDYDTFTFSAASNDVIYLTVLLTNGPGVNPYLYLYDPAGEIVTEGPANWYLTYVSNLRLTMTGTYTIGIVDDGLDESFDYLVTYNLAKGGVNQREPGDGPEAITPGRNGYGHISPNDYDTFTFSAASNDVLYLTVIKTNGPGNGPYLYLYDPAGEVIGAGNANWYLTYIANLRLTKTGTYTIGIVDDGLDESFDYLITYNLARGGVNQREPGDGPEAITPGQTGYGHISPNDYDTFTFSAVSNDVLYLTVIKTNGPGVNPYLYLYDPAGGIVAEGPANWYLTYVANLRLTMTGTYTVAIVDDGHDESFDYLITYNLARGGVNQREPGDGPEAITPGQTGYGHISPNDYDTFTFNAASNDVLYLTVIKTNGPGNGPYLYLYDPIGTVIGAGNANWYLTYVANLRLTKSGTYTVAVLDDGLDESFDYLVTLNLAKGGVNQREPGDGPEALVPGQTGYGHISPNDYDTFTFSAASNDVIYLSVIKTNGSGVNPYLYLYDPAGGIVAEGPANWYLTYVANLRLLKTGTYTVAVLDDGLDESFDYNVCALKIPGPNATDPGEGLYKLSPAETRSAHLSPGDLDAFEIKALAGDTLNVALRKTSGPGGNPVLSIYGPDASLLGTASGQDTARLRLQCVAQTGPYTVVIRDDGFDETYDYQLTMDQYPVVPESDGLTQYLAICDCTNRVVVRWETSAQPLGFVLEAIPAINSTSGAQWMASPDWAPVIAPFQVISDHLYFTESPTNATKFYRLRKPN